MILYLNLKPDCLGLQVIAATEQQALSFIYFLFSFLFSVPIFCFIFLFLYTQSVKESMELVHFQCAFI